MDSVYKPPRPSGFVKFLPESFSTHKFGSALNWLHLHANRKKASKLTQAHNWKGSLIHWAADTCASTISAKTITCHWFKSTHSWSVELTCGQLFDVLSWNVNKCLTVSLTQEQVKKTAERPTGSIHSLAIPNACSTLLHWRQWNSRPRFEQPCLR